jgi:hypothetical protein
LYSICKAQNAGQHFLLLLHQEINSGDATLYLLRDVLDMLGIAIRRLWGVQQRCGSIPFNHYRSLATISRYRPVPKLNTIFPRWQSSAAVEARRLDESESTIPFRDEETTSSSVVLRPSRSRHHIMSGSPLIRPDPNRSILPNRLRQDDNVHVPHPKGC